MKKTCWILLFFIAALYLLPAVFRPLMAPEEFRCAEISREMLASGNFISTKLLGVRCFEKPPMAYWLTAGSFKLFGQNAFALRLIPILGAVGSAFFLFLWCRRRKYSTETGVNAMFLYLSGTMVWLFGSFAAVDSLFCMWTTASLVTFAIAIESRELKERIFMLVCGGAAMGCGFLTMGFSAFVLPGISIAVYLLWQKRWKEFFLLPWIPLIVSSAVIAPWGLAIHKAEPEFWRYFIVYEHFQRFTTWSASEGGKPFWLLLPFFAAGLFPALFPVITALSGLRKNGWQELCVMPETRLSFCAAVLFLLFLSASGGKMPSYVLPCFAPAAMLGAMILDKIDPERGIPKLRKVTTVFSVIFVIIGSLALLGVLFYLLWGTGFIPTLPLKVAVWTLALTTAALGVVFSGTSLFVYRKNKLPEPCSFFILFGIPVLICVWFLPVFTANYKMPEYELLEIATQISTEKLHPPRIISSPELAHAAAWCFKDSSVRLLNGTGGLEYGHRYAVANGERPLMLSYSETSALLKNPARKEPILIIMRKQSIDEFSKHLDTGKQLTTAGELCAFYYPGNKGKTNTK